MKSGYETSSGHSTRSAFAVSRRRSSRSGSATGTVRSRPTSPSSISSAAAIPVISEICAFHCSTGSGARNWSPKPPSRCVITCSGIAQADPAAPHLALRAEDADLAQEPELLVGRAAVERPAGPSRSRAAPGCGRARAATVTSTPSPVSSTSIVQTTAGRVSSGSRLAAPSESTGG